MEIDTKEISILSNACSFVPLFGLNKIVFSPSVVSTATLLSYFLWRHMVCMFLFESMNMMLNKGREVTRKNQIWLTKFYSISVFWDLSPSRWDKMLVYYKFIGQLNQWLGEEITRKYNDIKTLEREIVFWNIDEQISSCWTRSAIMSIF